MTFKYEIYNENGDFLSDAETELFFVNKTNMRPIALPEKFLNKMY
jgi:acyl-CoA thioesterase FadM